LHKLYRINLNTGSLRKNLKFNIALNLTFFINEA